MKVIILTGKFGMGHYAAAGALAEQLSQQDPDAEILIADLYELVFSKYSHILYNAYASFVEKGCSLYNLAYRNAASMRPEDRQNTSLLYKYFLKCIKKYFHEEQPDVIISTYSLCSYLIGEYKRKTGCTIPLITCITDIESHGVWTNEETDLYLVAEECTKQDLIRKGIAAHKIKTSGIPVKSEFFRQDQMFAQKKSVLENPLAPSAVKKKELLIMGGGLGLLPCAPEFYKALDQLTDIHTTVITGKNRRLYRKLIGKYQNLTILGYTDRVAQLMRNADLIITKPGGITIFEAIHSGVPMLICKPFLQQEIKNGKFIEENHLGVVLEKKAEESMAEIIQVLNDDQLLRSIRENMKKMCGHLNRYALYAFLAQIKADKQNHGQTGMGAA